MLQCNLKVVIACTAVLVGILLRTGYICWIVPDNILPAEKEARDIVIGILSARQNVAHRNTIRETWLKSIANQPCVAYKFIVGEHPCDIHPANRKSEYSCDELALLPRAAYENICVLSKHEGTSRTDVMTVTDSRFDHLYWNISIQVHHPVIISRLGLHELVQMSNTAVSVKLYDTEENDIAFARFSLSDPGIVIGAYRYQPVSRTLLPKGFEGYIRIESVLNYDKRTKHGRYTIDNMGGAVEITFLDDVDIPVRNQGYNLLLSSFCISIYDVALYKERISNREDLNQQHRQQESVLSSELFHEQSNFRDILFVNVSDVYRNLPMKLLEFHRWANMHHDFNFLLKTDDDCYVDIAGIMERLSYLPHQTPVWWGHFREDWYVEKYGKWAESQYRSSVYPSFACGSGNIVSHHISHWLSNNIDSLKQYQGEDTSMGIWLSAVGPNYVSDERWKCDKTCSQNALVVPQLTPEEITQFWKNKLSCNNPCGC